MEPTQNTVPLAVWWAEPTKNNVALPVWWAEFKEEPRDGEEGGPHDVTTPPGQSTDLPLVLASDRAMSDCTRQNRPVRESGEGGGVPPSPETG